jgi:hypothetical protein
MMNRYVIKYKGEKIAQAGFALYGMGGTCSVKHLSYATVRSTNYKGLSKSTKTVIAKLLAKAAFSPSLAKANDKYTDFPGHINLRCRILLTAREGENNMYFTTDMIKLLGIQAGRAGPGGHGDYKMIAGFLDQDLHSNLVVDSDWTIEKLGG